MFQLWQPRLYAFHRHLGVSKTYNDCCHKVHNSELFNLWQESYQRDSQEVWMIFSFSKLVLQNQDKLWISGHTVAYGFAMVNKEYSRTNNLMFLTSILGIFTFVRLQSVSCIPGLLLHHPFSKIGIVEQVNQHLRSKRTTIKSLLLSLTEHYRFSRWQCNVMK